MKSAMSLIPITICKFKRQRNFPNKSKPILKGWKAKEPGGQHEDKGETAGEEDHSGGAHHLRQD